MLPTRLDRARADWTAAKEQLAAHRSDCAPCSQSRKAHNNDLACDIGWHLMVTVAKTADQVTTQIQAEVQAQAGQMTLFTTEG